MTDPRIDQLAATPKTLAHLLAEATDDWLDASIDGGWSARTVVAHLRDDEYLCMRVALERALAEDTPEVCFIEGADWVGNRNTTRDRKELLLADFALQRAGERQHPAHVAPRRLGPLNAQRRTFAVHNLTAARWMAPARC